MANKDTKTIKALRNWQLASNPLRLLTKQEIERMLDNARHGNDVRLQIAFTEVEKNTPVFQVCIQKRTAAILNRKWDIVPQDGAEDQARRVKKYFDEAVLSNIGGLTQALRHLALGAFRGRSAVKPYFTDDGRLRFKKVNNWNLLEIDDRLFWNPKGEAGIWMDEPDKLIQAGVQEVPPGELAWVKHDLPIDVPGIQIYLRQLVGEETWARYVERSGIPQIVITTPEGTPESQLDAWTQRAIQLCEGGSGCMPGGSTVTEMNGSRGQDPFSAYIQHQMELVAILATGGTLATLGGGTGLGSNLADVQNDQFQSLVNADCQTIANAINDAVVSRICGMMGEEQRCRFEFVDRDETTPSEYLDMAIKASQAGLRIDPAEFKRATGISWVQDGATEWTPPREV